MQRNSARTFSNQSGDLCLRKVYCQPGKSFSARLYKRFFQKELRFNTFLAKIKNWVIFGNNISPIFQLEYACFNQFYRTSLLNLREFEVEKHKFQFEMCFLEHYVKIRFSVQHRFPMEYRRLKKNQIAVALEGIYCNKISLKCT